MTIAHKKNSLERVIRDLVANKDYDKIKKIIQQLCNDFAYAVHQPHARNGGLIGLAAAAIALGPVCRQFLLLRFTFSPA
jgi:vacuole morphology and inheritance protein 14